MPDKKPSSKTLQKYRKNRLQSCISLEFFTVCTNKNMKWTQWWLEDARKRTRGKNLNNNDHNQVFWARETEHHWQTIVLTKTASQQPDSWSLLYKVFRIRVLLCSRCRTYGFPINSSDALPLSYGRLAHALRLSYTSLLLISGNASEIGRVFSVKIQTCIWQFKHSI